MTRRLRTFIADRNGSSVAEFAIISIPLMGLLMGMLDLGHTAYVRSVLQGEVDKAGRASSLVVPPSDPTQQAAYNTQIAAIDARVVSQIQSVVNVPSSAITFTRTNYTSFTTVTGEPFTDLNHNGVCDKGEPYADVNGNGHYDSDLSASGQGTANSIVKYQVAVTYTHLLPVYGLFGASPTQTLTATTILRNQPYAQSSNYSYTAQTSTC